MCQYYKKLHTCNCLSQTYLEMCRAGILSNTVCRPLDPPSENKADARKSYFACYECLCKEVRKEDQERLQRQMQMEQENKKMAEMQLKMDRIAEKQAKKDRVRREYAQKARAEREREEQEQEKLKAEAERAKKEGGLWIDAGASRKRGRKGGGGVGMAALRSAPPAPLGATAGWKMGEFGRKEAEAPKTSTGVDPGGRAGVWGPVAPKRILTNPEREAGKK